MKPSEILRTPHLKRKIARLITEAIDGGLNAEEKEEFFLEGDRKLSVNVDDGHASSARFLKRKLAEVES